jgi:ribosomal protein S18
MMIRRCVRYFSDVKKVLENEFYTNPHFRRAFPHLSQNLKESEDSLKERSGWAESLLYKRKQDPVPSHLADLEENLLFVEGYRTPTGPLKWMSQEDKDRIHAQIDFKMDELELTGLSREEILFDRPGGLPLSQDPVYQFLRANRQAREMLVRPGEEFTAYKVIDYALRQDLGVDKTKTLPVVDRKYSHQVKDTYNLDVMQQGKYPDMIQPEDYYFSEKYKQKLKRVKDFKGPAPLIFPRKWINPKRFEKNRQRSINLKDIHYKNTEFLSQFMTEGCRIKNRSQTRLPKSIQKRVATAIKHAKNLNLFPSQGFILPPHKMNLVPMHSGTFQNFVIHSETGTMFAKKHEGEISRLNDSEYNNTIETIAKQFEIKNNDENYQENITRSKGLIDYEIQFMPTKAQIDILDAHQYLIKGTGEGKETLEKLQKSTKNLFTFDLGFGVIKEKAADPDIVIYI